jgi:D-alanine--poly(phosphoribitol) ligase subunit 1
VTMDIPAQTATRARSISERLSSSLKVNSERLAVEDSGGAWALSYEQLSSSVELFRTSISQFSGTPLVFNMQKSPFYYAAVTACFRHRISFCPIDFINPIERVADIATQFSDALLFSDESGRHSALKARGLNSILIDTNGRIVDINVRVTSLSARTAELYPSYYIATSGSTGKPKVVSVPHDSTSDFVEWAVPFYQVDANTRWAQFSSIGFDLSLVDILTVLVGGGTLIILSSRLDRILPARAIQKSQITHWHSVPSVIPYILADTETKGQKSSCSLFTFCGEPLARIDVERLRVHFPLARIINTYGPTEGTLFCSFFECPQQELTSIAETVPIGAPIPGWYFVYLDDAHGSSRLIIVSNNIADGYFNQGSPSFRVIDFFGTPVKAFDTGDYFSRLGSSVYFSHRRDAMVKISGNRVDLGEVEAAAKKVGITNPIALYENGVLIVIGEGESQLVAEKRLSLSKLLPQYSIPSRICFNRVHPRTANGKIDRSAIRKEYFPA